jgi:hypothetical protein
MDVRIPEHCVEVRICFNWRTVFCFKFAFVLLAGGAYCRDLSLLGRVDRRDMGARDPAISDNANIVSFHG